MNNRFSFLPTPIDNLLILERHQIGDERGWLERLFCQEELGKIGWPTPPVQINRTRTVKRGIVRGMHFQNEPHAEAKLVTCLSGEVFDVAVDLRTESSTYLHWYGVLLSEKNSKSLVIPKGFAHGFQSLTEVVDMLYFHSAPYVAEAEGGIHPNDPRIGIQWPLRITEMSDRDSQHPLLNEARRE